MKTWQKVVKYAAMGFALLLTFGIFSTALNVVGKLVGGNNVLDTMKTHEITQTETIDGIYIDIEAAELTVTTGETFSLESNLKNIKVKNNKTQLFIDEDSKNFLSLNGKKTPKINLVLPDKIFGEIEIETGAGKVEIEKLSANHLSLEFGAGAVSIDYLQALTSVELDNGAGETIIKDGILHNAQIEMGVGKLEVSAKLTGVNAIQGGVGEMHVCLVGLETEYQVFVKTGLGAAYIKGEKVKTETSYGTGSNRLNIKGGIGAINVTFKE